MAEVVTEQKKRIADNAEAEKACAELEHEIHGLRAAFEQYFLGIERHAPTQKRRDFKKRVEDLRTAFVQQTSTRFRINTLHQRLITYERLWDRTLMEMENGTYRRDLFKARRRSGLNKAVKETELSAKGKADVEDDDDFDVDEEEPMTLPAASAKAAAKPAQAPVRTAEGPLSEEKLKAIYSAYITAKKRCNEDTTKLTFDTVAANLRKQVPQLMKQHNAKGIDFKIVIKDGKAVLRAVPKT